MSETVFDYVKSIMTDSGHDYNSEFEEGVYYPFVVNRALSVHIDTLFYANDMNILHKTDNKMQYDYLYNSIKKTKRPFIQYPKKKESERIAVIMEVYKYNVKKAKEVSFMLSEEQYEQIKEMLFRGG